MEHAGGNAQGTVAQDDDLLHAVGGGHPDTAVPADLMGDPLKDIKLYIKPQDGACYYVADGKVAGRVDLF